MSFGKVDLGLAMAVAAIEAALADPARLVGFYLAAAGGTRVIGIRPALGGEATASLVWQEYRPGPGGVFQLSGGSRAMSPEVALVGMQESIRASDEAVLVVATRMGATSFEFEDRGTRRTSMTPDQAAAMFGQLPLPKPPRSQPARDQAAPVTPPPMQSNPAARAADPAPVQAAPVAQSDAPPAAAAASTQTHLEVVTPPLPRDIAAILAPDRAGSLLAALGLLGAGGQIKRDERRKHNQIVHLISQIADVLRGMPRDRELIIVDAGCGKSQLSFVLNHVLTEGLGLRARLIGLDVSAQAVESARALQHKLGYANMSFAQAAIRSWRPPGPIDMVLSLHACDTATDEAIALGIAAAALAIVAVPCCQAELARQAGGDLFAAALRHGTLRRRFGDWVTDALRALYLEAEGYAVDVLEYISPLDTPKNIMLRARRAAVGGGVPAGRREAARAEFELICREFDLDPSLPHLHRAMAAQSARQ
jgi:SAM-dependent methyltransferase